MTGLLARRGRGSSTPTDTTNPANPSDPTDPANLPARANLPDPVDLPDPADGADLSARANLPDPADVSGERDRNGPGDRAGGPVGVDAPPGVLARMALVIATHARSVLVVSLLVAAVAAVLGTSVLGLMTNDTADSGAPSARAAALVESASGSSATPGDITLVVDLAQPWPSVADQATVTAVASQLAAVPGVNSVVSPVTTEVTPSAAGLVSRDGRAVLVTAGVSTAAKPDDVMQSVQRLYARSRTVSVGGAAAVNLEVDDRISSDLERAEILAFPVLFLLALWIFRGAVAAAVPLLVAGFSIVATLAAMRIVVIYVSLSQYVLNLVIGLGLGLAIDYTLLVISRYREEALVDGYGRAAVVRTVARAGRTVLFSASTVACALATLMLFPQKFLYSMGVGGVLVTLTSAGAAVTVLPAVLILLGPRIDSFSLARWQRARLGESADPRAGSWYLLSRLVMKRARLALGLALVLVAVLTLPALFTRFGDVDQTSLPTSSPARMVSDRIAAEFAGAGGSEVLVVVSAARSDGSAVAALQRQVVATVPGAQVAPVRYLGRGVWLGEVGIAGSPFAGAVSRAVERIRAVPSTVPFLVGGDAAAFVDLQASVGAHLPWALGLVGLAIVFVMFLLTGSVTLAVKTLVLNVANVAMTFGVLVWVFQFGHLEWLLRFQSTGRIDLTQPILVAIIAFGLSTDYGVFLFSRIKEAHDEGLSDVEAVSVGLGRSGRIISSAALLLCVAIGAFSTSSVLFIKQLGVGAAVAVVLDATLVRAVLVPSAMKLMGPANWWAPGPLARWFERHGLDESGPRPAAVLNAQPGPSSDPVRPQAAAGVASVAAPVRAESPPLPIEVLVDALSSVADALETVAPPSRRDLSPAQVRVLRVLDQTGPMSSARLAAALAVSTSTLRRTLDALVAGGLVSRRENPADRRQRLLAITDTGWPALLAVEDGRRTELARWAAEITPGRRAEVEAGLRTLIEASASAQRPPVPPG